VYRNWLTVIVTVSRLQRDVNLYRRSLRKRKTLNLVNSGISCMASDKLNKHRMTVDSEDWNEHNNNVINGTI
jgi:hypothetical protein